MAKKPVVENAVPEAAPELAPRIALKDFLIVQNEVRIEIKKGQDLSTLNIPDRFWPNLVTENVVKP